MKNIHLILIIQFTISSININAQEYDRSIDGKGFNTIFKKLDSGIFDGTINGLLIINDSFNNELLLDFQGSIAKLEIIKDEYEVYDSSYKKYVGFTTSNKTKIIYKTYCLSNSFGLEYKGDFYEYSLIDGSCDLVINGLNYKYSTEKGIEYLSIFIDKEIVLSGKFVNGKKQSIKLMPNSTLVFAIKHNVKL